MGQLDDLDKPSTFDRIQIGTKADVSRPIGRC